MENNTVNINLFPKQTQCWRLLTEDKTVTHILYGGAAGGGKSYLGCLWIVYNCLMYPDTRWLIGRSSLKNLKLTTLKTLLAVINQLGYKDKFIYNAQSSVITCTNGSEIILKDLKYYPSDPDFTELGGLEITGAFIDEASEVIAKAIEIVTSRIRYNLKKYKLIPKVLMSCNPSKNWCYVEYYVPFKNDTLPKNKAYIQALPTDNPNIEESYLTLLNGLKPASRARLLYAQWEFGEPDVLFDVETLANVYISEYISEKPNYYLSCDIARMGNDKSICVLWDNLTVVKVFEYSKQTLDVTTEDIKRIIKEYNIDINNVIVDTTGVGAGVTDSLKCVAFESNQKSDGFQNLKTACYDKLSQYMIDNKVKILNTDTELMVKINQELECLKYEDKFENKVSITSKDMVKKSIGRSPDYSDAIMMRMYYEIKPKNDFYVYKRRR